MLEKKIQLYYKELQDNIYKLDQKKIFTICQYLKKKF